MQRLAYRGRRLPSESLGNRIRQRLAGADVALLVLVHDPFVLVARLLSRERPAISGVAEAALERFESEVVKLREVDRLGVSPATRRVVRMVLREVQPARRHEWRV